MLRPSANTATQVVTAACAIANDVGVLPPGVSSIFDIVARIVHICQNVKHNKKQAGLLAKECQGVRDIISGHSQNLEGRIALAVKACQACLESIESTMDLHARLSWFESFNRRNEITQSIGGCHAQILACLSQFNLKSQLEIHSWQQEFTKMTSQDREEAYELLSAIAERQAAHENDISTLRNEIITSKKELKTEILEGMRVMVTSNNSETQGTELETARKFASWLMRECYILPPRTDLSLWSSETPYGDVRRIRDQAVAGDAMHDIYQGILELTGEKVDLKVLRAVSFEGTEQEKSDKRRRFQRALNIWREVWDRHRGPSKNYFLPFYGSVTLQNWPCIVSPWQANGTADKWINEKRQFRDIDFQAFFLKLANGFVLLHEWKPHPIAHGDIRGANILVGDDCEPLIAEFGLATIITEASGMDLTKTNSRGSIRWQAPELLTGKLSTASDVYAFGMLMFELLTGKQPFHNIRGISNIVRAIDRGATPECPEQMTCLTKQYMPLLRSCWDKDSSKRPTMREVADRLASEITP